MTTSSVAISEQQVEELTLRLRTVLARLTRGMRQEVGHLLTPSQAALLATIARHEPLTPSELAARERVSRPTVTRLLAKLSRRELIDCVDDPGDGRSYRVVVSPAGVALRANRRATKNAYLASLLTNLDADQLAVLEEAVEILGRVLPGDP